jgi:hypothetical protein
VALGSSTFSDLGGAVSDLFAADADRSKAKGDAFEKENYTEAADLADQNEKFTEASTAIKQAQNDRQLTQTLGGQASDVANAGFSASGSALDIMRDSASQGALTKAVAGEQGLITEAGYKEQADSYNNMAQAAQVAIDAENKAAEGADITAGIKGAAAVASLFTGVDAAGPTFSGDMSEGYSEDPGSLAQSSMGGGYGGGAFG